MGACTTTCTGAGATDESEVWEKIVKKTVPIPTTTTKRRTLNTETELLPSTDFARVTDARTPAASSNSVLEKRLEMALLVEALDGLLNILIEIAFCS